MALLAVASPLKTLYPNPNPRPVRRRLLRSSILHLPPLLTRSGRLRCSAAYGEAAAATPTTPRPDEIPWSRDLCNSVRLIGTVGIDVELRQLPSGAAVARGRIAVWKSATETTWNAGDEVDSEDGGEPAPTDVDAADVYPSSYTAASGCDVGRRPPEGKHPSIAPRSVLLGIPLIRERERGDGRRLVSTPVYSRGGETEQRRVTLAFWDDLAVVASEHVKKGDRIYVSGRLVSDTVDEGLEKRQVYYKVVVQQLNFIESFQPVQLYEPEPSQDTQGGKRGHYVDSTSGSTEDKNRDHTSSSRSTEELWQAFFANPLDWWDNRTNKKNPRYPDFKHKHTSEALWVDGRYNPIWVISQLAILDSRMGSLQDSERKPVSFMYADDFMASGADTEVSL